MNVDDDSFNLEISGIDQPFGSFNATSPDQPSSTPAARRKTGSPKQVRQSPAPRSSSVAVPSPVPDTSRRFVDEVGESPANAPGSGKRRRVPVGEVTGTSSRLQNALISSDEPTRSPPRARIARPTAGSPIARQNLPLLPSTSPAALRFRRSPTPVEEEEEEAEEIDATTAAHRILAPARREPSVSEPSSPPDDPAPALKRRLIRSPAAQRQPVKRPRKLQRPAKAGSVRSNRSGGGSGAAVDVIVQRFVDDGAQGDDEDGDGNIPFANNSGETVVDVLLSLCEEVLESSLRQYEYIFEKNSDKDIQKKTRHQILAVEAYRDELSSRLLQHVSLLICAFRITANVPDYSLKSLAFVTKAPHAYPAREAGAPRANSGYQERAGTSGTPNGCCPHRKRSKRKRV